MNLAGALVAVALTITTQNVRVGMPPDRAHHDITQAARHSSVVITQEMGKRRASNFAPPHWGTAHHAGLRQGDCATYWDRRVWRRSSSSIRMLTHAPFRAGLRYALVTRLVHRDRPHLRLAVVCVHMVTRSLAPGRRVVYSRGMDRLRNLLATLNYRHVVVGGDWNRDWPQRARLPGFRTVEPRRATGSHGGRIDYLWWRSAAERGTRVVGGTFSDHNGVRVHLLLRS